MAIEQGIEIDDLPVTVVANRAAAIPAMRLGLPYQYTVAQILQQALESDFLFLPSFLKIADYTAADVLTKLLTVDGSGSGLDADKLRNTTPSANGLSLIGAADYAAMRTLLGTTWRTLGTTSITAGTGQVAFTGLTARRIQIEGFVRPTTDSVSVMLQTSVDGVSYDFGGSDYSYQNIIGDGASGSFARGTDSGASLGIGTIGNAANEGVKFWTTIDRFNEAQHCWISTFYTAVDASGNLFGGLRANKRLSTTARTALRVVATGASPTMADGQITIRVQD